MLYHGEVPRIALRMDEKGYPQLPLVDSRMLAMLEMLVDYQKQQAATEKRSQARQAKKQRQAKPTKQEG